MASEAQFRLAVAIATLPDWPAGFENRDCWSMDLAKRRHPKPSLAPAIALSIPNFWGMNMPMIPSPTAYLPIK